MVAAAKLQAEALLGSTVTLRLILQPDWSVVSDAIGGGPVLVRDGVPVYRSNEAFTIAQLAPRGPRTAPRRWSVCASSKFVIPTEYPG